MKKAKQTYKREWLNDKAGRAYIITSTHVDEEAVSASLELADCSRSIDLEFYAYDEKQIASRLRKIDRIRAGLDAIEDALLEGLCTMINRKEWKEINKAREAEGGNRHAVSLSDL